MTPEQFATLRADVLAELRATVERHLSPWRTRSGAALYLQCSERQIDELLATGALPRKYLGSKPMISVKDLDAVLSSRKP